MRVLIHIGVHKTGSSALQAFLKRNASTLKRLGFLYQTEEKWPLSHSPLANSLNKAHPDYNVALATTRIERLLRDAVDNECHTVLISSEVFCEGYSDVDVLRSALEEQSVEFLAYLRRPDELILSTYDELVRSPVKRWQEKFAESALLYDPTYREVLKRWINSQIGKLVLAPYDREQWKGHSLFLDFLDMLGIDDPTGFDFHCALDDANRTLPAALTEVLRLTNWIETDPRSRETLIADLYRLWDENPSWFPPFSQISAEQRRNFCGQLEVHLDYYRPHFRPGFKEDFLLPSAVGPVVRS